MRLAAAASALVLVAAGVAACGRFATAEESTPPPDSGAGNPAIDAAPRLDSAAADAGIQLDDFDRAMPLGGVYAWRYGDGDDAGPSSLSTEVDGDADPGSLAVRVSASGAKAFIASDLDPSKRLFRVVFAMKINQPLARTQLASIDIHDHRNVLLEINDGVLAIGGTYPTPADPAGQTDSNPTTAVPSTAWGHYELVVDLREPATVELLKDGVSAGKNPLAAELTSNTPVALAPFAFRLGVLYSEDTSGTATIHFDDVGIGQQ